LRKRLQVAIDGPAGAGKSTVARQVASKLGYLYLDTGAMYRALAVSALKRNVPLNDGEALGKMACGIVLDVRDDGRVFRVFVDGEEVTGLLRSPETERAVKVLAMAKPVREVLVKMQREFARRGGVVMEGRDIGSVVMPDAEVKVFLTASLRERARRRWQELSKRGVYQPWEEVMKEMRERDEKDLEREWGRLIKVDDAVLIDSSGKTVDEVCEEIMRLCEVKASCCTG